MKKYYASVICLAVIGFIIQIILLFVFNNTLDKILSFIGIFFLGFPLCSLIISLIMEYKIKLFQTPKYYLVGSVTLIIVGIIYWYILTSISEKIFNNLLTFFIYTPVSSLIFIIAAFVVVQIRSDKKDKEQIPNSQET
ncbi:MAG: hypothetical protein ACRC5M_05045 [Anaeroplasmataceae bacterium]